MATALASTPREDELASWRECSSCGLFQILPAIEDGEAAHCARCDKVLRRAFRDSAAFARISAVVAALLLLLALYSPFVELRLMGRVRHSNLFTGPRMLWEHGLPELAVVIVCALIVMPATKLALELTVLFGVRAQHPPRFLPWIFAWLERISPWAMVEVFLLGAFVAYTRLRALAQVEFGDAIVAMGGVMVATLAIDATFDREAIWEELEAKEGRLPPPSLAPPPFAAPDRSLRLLGCHHCGRVARANEGDACRRCRHPLVSRKSGGPTRVWALLLAGALLYIPANVLPVMTVVRLGRGAPTTIIRGVVELAQDHLWPLAILVLLASVIVPVVKLASLVAMLVMTHRRSAAALKGRTRLFRFIQAVGRWSMIDIFMLATLVGVVRFGFLARVTPGMGALAFCAVVVVTMAATEMFDPRWMWDAASRAGDRPSPEAVPS